MADDWTAEDRAALKDAGRLLVRYAALDLGRDPIIVARMTAEILAIAAMLVRRFTAYGQR